MSINNKVNKKNNEQYARGQVMDGHYSVRNLFLITYKRNLLLFPSKRESPCKRTSFETLSFGTNTQSYQKHHYSYDHRMREKR